MANVSKLRLNGISYDIKDNDAREQLTLIQNQINQLIAPSGEAPNPAQIQNARIGVDGVVYDTLGNAIRTQINNLNNIIINNGGGLSIDAKMALLTCFQKVAWIDDQGQIYYNALYNSLFPTAISISVIFNSASHVFYDTDTLNDLRPYLTVRATLPDNTTEIITNYSLRGSMTVGTNIITVQYQELTDTFSVTVAANPSYITAVFTQPSATIYTDDSLDGLKSNLVVTYYSAPGATGTVVASSAYTLIGTLTEGTSVITAEYQGLTDTFEVADVVDPIIYQNSNVVFTGHDSLEVSRWLTTDIDFTIAIDFTKQKSNSDTAMWSLIDMINDQTGYPGLLFRRDLTSGTIKPQLVLKWMTNQNLSKIVPGGADYEGNIKVICVHTAGSDSCTYHWKFGSNSRDSMTLTDTFVPINNSFYVGSSSSEQILIGTLNSIAIEKRAWASSRIDSFFTS